MAVFAFAFTMPNASNADDLIVRNGTTYITGPVDGNVIVKNGGTAVLRATVDGSIIVKKGGIALLGRDATVLGNVEVGPDGELHASSELYDDETPCDGGPEITIEGNIQAQGKPGVETTLELHCAEVFGNLQVNDATLQIYTVTIEGSVQYEGGYGTELRGIYSLPGPEVFGDVQITKMDKRKFNVGSATVTISDATIRGSIKIEENILDSMVIGIEDPYFPGNVVWGDVQVSKNKVTDFFVIQDNTIDGNLQCKENTGDPSPREVNGNDVEGDSDC